MTVTKKGLTMPVIENAFSVTTFTVSFAGKL
jgi:hypothetical protein